MTKYKKVFIPIKIKRKGQHPKWVNRDCVNLRTPALTNNQEES